MKKRYLATILILVAAVCSFASVQTLLYLRREETAKAAKFDEVCSHVESYLRTRATVLGGTEPKSFRALVGSETPNYVPIRFCVAFPDDHWLACHDDACRAALLDETARKVGQ